MSNSVTVGCFLWRGEPAARGVVYGPEHVQALQRQVARYLPGARFFCVADRDVPGVATFRIPTPTARKRYPKLMMWCSSWTERTLWLDLDTVIVDDLAPLVDRPEPIVLWRDPSGHGYNTSMVLMDPGAAPAVWEDFTPERARKARGGGSDQAWVGHVLGKGVPTWTETDGVLSYKKHCRRGTPKGAKIVFFHGQPKSWDLPEWRERWEARG